MFNIYQTQQCKDHVQPEDLHQSYMDSCFVLSCINQYYYARYATTIKNKDQAKDLED